MKKLMIECPVDYWQLAYIFQQAIAQAAYGKGRRRHAQDEKPWLEQPIHRLAKVTGPGGPLFQVHKKTEEAIGLCETDGPTRAFHEVLGAINYNAELALLFLEQAWDLNEIKEGFLESSVVHVVEEEDGEK